MSLRILLVVVFSTVTAISQVPLVEPGVSHELAKWRAARYSDVRYKLNLTLEKMSPVLKGTMELRMKVGAGTLLSPSPLSGETPPIILDWRKIKGHEANSTVLNVTVNGKPVSRLSPRGDKSVPAPYEEINEHLIFRDGVVAGENVIKLDFTSPILTSGSAITRYVDKEDGAEYIYSLFVPSDASTAFPVFDQPDLKARFKLVLNIPDNWRAVSNSKTGEVSGTVRESIDPSSGGFVNGRPEYIYNFEETKPISTYVFAFAAGPWERVSEPPAVAGGLTRQPHNSDQGGSTQSTVGNTQLQPPATAGGSDKTGPATSIYVRKSQAEKFKPHAAEVFRLNREGIKFLESYFDYKFPFPKYDVVLIPEFPFGGMEHAGATFLRESSVIFPQEPTKNDYISRANVIFHEAAHQWFGDTVTMKWFDDLWLKEGFAEFMAYKTLEKVMPEYNAWKVFYERNKQAAYLTDSTKGTTPIYQVIANLNSAKSAYGNIVYRKAPSFLRQAEFYLGEDKFQTAVRAFLKKHEFANAGWEDLVKEFEAASGQDLKEWANAWVLNRGLPNFSIGEIETFSPHIGVIKGQDFNYAIIQRNALGEKLFWRQKTKALIIDRSGSKQVRDLSLDVTKPISGGEFIFSEKLRISRSNTFIFPNYQDYGYGIFLLDDKSRDYVLKNIHTEKDDFLRTMMWGSLWDSVREGELDPREYVELVIKVLSPDFSRPSAAKKPAEAGTQNGEQDESTIQTLLGRVSTAMTYYMSEPPAVAGGLRQRPANADKSPVSDGKLQPPATAGGSDKSAAAADLRVRLENLLIGRMQNAPTLGQRITFYRAFLNMASTENARGVLKKMLAEKGGNLSGSAGVPNVANAQAKNTLPTGRVSASGAATAIPLKTKDRFDIVMRLLILSDADAPALLAGLEKTETSDEAKRYAYAAKAGIATAENKAKFWGDFTTSKEISESWIEAAFGPFNSTRHADLTLPYLERALKELPNHKRNRKIFFVNGWLGAFIGGQRSEGALAIVNKFLADNPNLDKDLRLKILENVDLIERAVKIRGKYAK